MQQLQQGSRNLTPSYISKFTLYVEPTGGLVLLVGNQFLQVSEEEARKIVDSVLTQSKAISNGRTE